MRLNKFSLKVTCVTFVCLNLIDWIDGTYPQIPSIVSWIVLNEWDWKQVFLNCVLSQDSVLFPTCHDPSLWSLSLRYRVCDSVYSTLTNLQPKGFQSVFVCTLNWCLWGLATFVRFHLGAMLPSLDFVPCVFYCGPCEFAVGLPCVLYPSEIQHWNLLQCLAFVFAKF